MKPKRRRRKLGIRKLANATSICVPPSVKTDRNVKRFVTNILTGQF